MATISRHVGFLLKDVQKSGYNIYMGNSYLFFCVRALKTDIGHFQRTEESNLVNSSPSRIRYSPGGKVPRRMFMIRTRRSRST